MKEANPTTRTQEEIIKAIRKNDNDTPMTITALASKTNKSVYQVRASVKFLSELGVVELIRSTGGTTLIKLKETDNART